MDHEHYKILLADDEGIVTDSLQYIIAKHFGSDCQCAIAKNGRQAIELAESFRPDIAFLDIRMPGISGLKAMEEIRSQNNQVKIFILTAYDNVEYTKEALRLGAVDYLTKPINKKAIVEQLTKCMATIDKERQKRKDDLLNKEKMEAMTPIIENGFIISLILQRGDEDSIAHYKSLLNLTEEYGITLVLEWRGSSEKSKPSDQANAGIHLYHHYDKIVELVKVYFRAFISGVMGNKLICALPCSEPYLEYSQNLNTNIRTLLSALKQVVGIDFKVGVGTPRTWETLFDGYQEALNALRHGKGSITHIGDLMVQDGHQKHRQLMEQEVLKAVSKGFEYEVRREATLFSRWALKSQTQSLQTQRIELVSLLLVARRMVQEQGGSGQVDVDALLCQDSEEGLQQAFVAAMVALTQTVVIKKQAPESVIPKAQAYIQENFRKDLALEDVAKTVGISPFYLSKLFKEEVGVTFMDYLTSIRIETAKRLLSDGQMSIKQVCIDAGYSNPNYFSRIFKKWVGITPTEFRDELQ
ncbi:response regulator [Bengtsoniella intestinalis]|uniref:response regulator transcription factor n=1 Tax=Bengtsoniella intestinalis TaxID=3073143 RepID=UPI00391F7CF8